MASILARRAANLTRLTVSTSPSSVIPRRGLAGAADHHGSTKKHIWQEPMNPGNWIEEEFVIASLAGWGLLIFGGYKFFTGGKKTQEKSIEAA